MPNLRIIYSNAADRGTTVASTTAGALVVANLRTYLKGQPWRASATTARLTQTWTTPEAVGAAILPYCNFSPTATMRLRLSAETAATNRLLYSEVQSNAAYTKSATTIGSAALALDGATSALPVLDTAATSLHYITQVSSLSSGNTYTFSMFVKASGRTRMRLENGSLGAFADFNLTTGLVVNGSGTGYVSSAIQALPSSWFRVSLTFAAAATSSQSMNMYLQDATGTQTYLGNGTSGIYSWGWQVEANPAATSYYPTTSTTLVRPAGYIDTWQSYTYDSGVVLCSPAAQFVPDGWTAAAAANAYAYGGGACARVWATANVAGCLGMALDIVDTSNLQGYIEASRLVAGAYWEPAKNADYGAGVTPLDTSKNSTSDAGDLITDIGTKSKKISFSLSKMDETDATQAWNLLFGNGSSKPAYVSIFPNDASATKEVRYQAYGKLVTLPSMNLPSFNIQAATLEIASI